MSAVVMDSSAWLTFFEGSGNADVFEDAILAADPLIVPSICLAEVFKVLLRQVDVALALRAVAQMRLGEVVDLDADLALAGVERYLLHSGHLGDALRAVAVEHPRDRIPLVVTQSEAMGLGADLAASAGIRLERLRRILAGSRVEASDVWIVLGALVGALNQWATHQAPRVELGDALEEGLGRIREALDSRSVATLF